VFETAECEEGKEFHTFGAEIRKAGEPSERLCRKSAADERVDLVGLSRLWYSE